ncbi:MAG: hypothetical protein HY721_03430 [Planctomycetes bacterium]|nr:hypothetical protein [Planctomycetota bacterium]
MTRATPRRIPIRLWTLAALGALAAGRAEAQVPAEPQQPGVRTLDAEAEMAAPAPEVLQAIRLLVSSDPKEEERGRRLLEMKGIAAAPQLRYWVRKVHAEAERVKAVLAGLEGREKAPSLESMSAQELLHRKLLECRALVKEGEYSQAVDLAEAVLLLDKHGPHAWELRRLSRRARERLVTREALEPRLEAEKLVYEAGEQPTVAFRLANRHSREARIRLDKGVLGECDVTVTRKQLGGEMRLERTKLRIQAPPEVRQIVIGPGKTWEREVLVDLGEALPLAGAVARVQVEGMFRPSQWAVEDIGANLGLSIDETEIWVVPPGETALCEQPLEKLAVALLAGKREALFVAGQISVWAGEDDAYLNERVVEMIVSSIEDLDPQRLQVAGRLLEEATGQGFGVDAGRWKAWWAKLRG